MDNEKLEKLLKIIDPVDAIKHIEALEALVRDIHPIENMSGQLFGIQEKVPRALEAWFGEKKRVLESSPLLEKKKTKPSIKKVNSKNHAR